MRWCIALFVILFTAHVTWAEPTEITMLDADYSWQGEYSGTMKHDESEQKYGIQVIALGEGKFRAVGYPGGLPGDGFDTTSKKPTAEGTLANGSVVFEDKGAKGILKDGKITLEIEGKTVGVLEKVERQSPTLGAKPPAGAVVLFDGTTADNFEKGKMSEDKLLMQGCTSKQKFGSHKLHIEFRTPYTPKARGQGRGNSGIYLQGRYEVQMLDSFGLAGEQNECGGIYSVGKPAVNMCFPPFTWQTYDIEYTAGKYDAAGKVVEHPRVTVYHNGVKIHDDQQLPGERNTTAAPLKAGPEPGPIYLQDHGNPVRYRNIWVVEQ